MATTVLTDHYLRSLAPRAHQFEVFDKKIVGFGVRVSPSGTKAFQVLYRSSGRSRRLTIGRYPILSLADARQIAKSTLHAVATGRDPAVDKADRARNPIRFCSFADEFIQRYAKQKNRSWRETQRVLQHDFVRVWKSRDVRDITKVEVVRVLDGILERGAPIAANRAFAAIRKLFNWGVERGLIASSPCMGLKPPAANSSRDRVLKESEIAAIWSACSGLRSPFRDVVRLLFLTDQRLSEVSSMRWSDIDLDRALWSIPSKDNKSKRPHEVPLTKTAVGILRSITPTSSDLVFPAKGSSRPISGFSKWKAQLDRETGVSNWTLHDIRRTVATGMAGHKVPPHVVERLLNHKSGTFSGVAGIYNRFGYLDEMREALDTWDAHLQALTQLP